MAVLVHRSTDNRMIAVITDDGILEKHVEWSKHLLKRVPGWAHDAWAWKNYRDLVRVVRIYDDERGDVYEISAEDFDKHREAINDGPRHGTQYAVNLNHWTKNGTPPEVSEQGVLF